VRAIWAVWPLALWLAVMGNLPLWQRIADIATQPAQRALLLLVMGGLVLGATAALLSLLAWPRAFRPLASGLVLVSAFNSHFMWQYGAVIDPTMLANVAQTDAREVRDLLSWQLLGTVLLVAGPPLWWIWRRPVAWGRWLPQTGRNLLGAGVALLLVLGVVLAGYQGLASLMRNHKPLRYMINPLNSVYAASRLAAYTLLSGLIM
jgi:lipid A ethanolaminephosphotransferase